MWLLSPLSWLLVAALAAPFAWRGRQRRPWWWRGCVGLLLLSVSAMTPLLANAMLSQLERAAPADPACRDEPPTTVVVLGGGIDRLPQNAADFGVLDIASRRRLDSGIAYWRTRPGRTLVITGGPAEPGMPAESRLMAAYAVSIGVPAAALRLETRATSTWQNAQRLAQLQPALAHRMTLATSALHMQRAQLAFRAAGFAVCPLPSDYRFTPNDLPDALIPRSSALGKSEAALHEWVGLVYYRLRALRSGAGTTD